MFVSYGSWRDYSQLNARLAFEKNLRALIPMEAPLFATRGLDVDEVMVLAYRLKREIDRRPLACAKRDDYFLALTDNLAAGQAQVLALLDRSKVALVRVVDESHYAAGEACKNDSFQNSDSGDV